jgi:predicted KAP-like P-loop ATPase
MNKNPPIESDKALIDIKDDALGVAGQAGRMASSIMSRTSQEGLVIGLYGAWGSGKTTFINFIEQFLKKVADKNQPIIMRFNPWLFSGHEDLIQRYLIELSKTLDPGDFRSKQKRKEFAEGVENLSNVSEQLLLFAAGLHVNPFFASGVKALSHLSKRAIKQLKSQESLSTQKEKIENLLTESKKKILVIIDDIDRLEPKEILDIFRTVKSAADFPNVIYLLSFDKNLVHDVIKDSHKSDGQDYLEKIIQYDIDLPPADAQGVLKLFGERIDPIIEAKGGKEWNKERWAEFYRDYLREKLKTPRQAVRLSNAFNLAYSSLRGEVDPVDFLAIEAIRMFDPRIFNEIRDNTDKYTEFGQGQFEPGKTDPPYFKKVIGLVDEKDQEAVKSVLEIIFPRVKNAFSNFKMSSDTRVSEWRTQGRICSSHHINRYFSYSISSDQFSDAEIKDAIALTADSDAFGKLIVDYSKQILGSGRSRIPEFLERLLDHVKAGQADAQLKEIVKCFIIFGDHIIREEDEDRGFMRIGTDMRILWIINSAMGRLQKEEVPEVLKEAYRQTKSIHTPLRLLYYLGKEHGKYGNKQAEAIRDSGEPFLTTTQADDLEAIILPKVAAAAADYTLLENASLHSVLYRWRDITGNFDGPRDFVKKATATDEGFKKFLSKLATVTVTSNMERTTETVHVHADTVQNFLDLGETYNRAQSLLTKGVLDSKEKIALEAYVSSYQDKKNEKSEEGL